MGILKKLALILLFLYPLGQIGRVELLKNVSITVLDSSVFIIVLYWLVLIRKKIVIKKIYLAVIGFVLFGFLGLVINFMHLSFNEFVISLLYLVRWIFYFLLYLVFLGFDKNFKDTIRKTLIIVGAVILGIGFIQYFFYPNLANLLYLGWDDHLYRLFTSFLDPNFAGSFFVLYFIFVFGMFFDVKKKTTFWYILLSILLLTLLGIVFTFSRSSYIMFFVSVCVFAILKKQKQIILLIVGLIIAVAIFSNSKIEGLNIMRTASTLARVESLHNVLFVIQKNPVFGVGFNAFRYAQISYGLKQNKTKFSAHADAGSDNSFLFAWATTGIFGFLCFICVWILIVQSYYLRYLQKRDTSSIVVISSLLGLFINSLFNNSLFYAFIMAWVWILLAITENT